MNPSHGLRRLLSSLVLILSFTLSSGAQDKPNVLLLGDSISIGYTAQVQKLLATDAKVVRPMQANGKRPENCAYSANGLKRIDVWLGDTDWDIIHFNFGLHDLKYIGQALPNAKIVPQVGAAIQQNPEARQLCSVEDYAANLEKLVVRLQKSGATLIFCTTTPVPKGARGRLPGDEVRYNAAATVVMKKHKVRIDDLHAFALTPKVAATQRDRDVHYSKEGSTLLAEEVARSIQAARKAP